jgi:transcriptional regulator with XRE-family HTH domain
MSINPDVTGLRGCIMVACMSKIGTWADYLKLHSQGDRQGVVAEKTGVQSSTVKRWLTGETVRPSAQEAINFARAYNRSPIEALIHATYIKVDEVGQAVEMAGSMKDVSDTTLLEELSDRLAELRGRLTGDEGEGWSSAGWAAEDPGVGRVEYGD